MERLLAQQAKCRSFDYALRAALRMTPFFVFVDFLFSLCMDFYFFLVRRFSPVFLCLDF